MKTPRKFSVPRTFPMPLWLQGAVEALVSGIFTLVLLALAVLLGWFSLGAAGGPGALVAATGQLWLASHGVALHLDVPPVGDAAAAQGTARLLPLGLTWIALLFCRRAGARLARASWEGQFWQPVLGGLAAYALLGLGLALFTGTDVLSARPVEAAVVPLWIPLVGLMWGGHRVSGSWLRLLGVSPEVLARRYGQYTRWAGAYLVTVVRAARVGTLALLAGGALLLGLAVLWNWNDVIVLNQNLHAGLFGEVVLLLIQAALLPNAVLCATSWATGAGFSLGAGTEISPAITHVSGLPSLPLLGTVSPDPGAWAHLVLAIPLLAGALAGWWFVREGEDHLDDWFALRLRVRAVSATLSALVLAVLLGMLSGAATALLATLAGGSLGVGSWTDLGPAPGPLFLWTWVVTGLGALLGRALAPLLEGPRKPARDRTTSKGSPSRAAGTARGRKDRSRDRADDAATGADRRGRSPRRADTRTTSDKTAANSRGTDSESPKTASDRPATGGVPAAGDERSRAVQEEADSEASASLSALERMRRARTGPTNPDPGPDSEPRPDTGAAPETPAEAPEDPVAGPETPAAAPEDPDAVETAEAPSPEPFSAEGSPDADSAAPGPVGDPERDEGQEPDGLPGRARTSGVLPWNTSEPSSATDDESEDAPGENVAAPADSADHEDRTSGAGPSASDGSDEVPAHRPVVARPGRRRRP